MKSETSVKYHCQAIDSIENRKIGCCNPVEVIEEDIQLQRPSVKVTYLMFCKVHIHRLLIHNCCPTCGLFCTQVSSLAHINSLLHIGVCVTPSVFLLLQGNFVMCESHHMYHRKCELLIEDKRVCPHCGQISPKNDIHIMIGRKNPVFLPVQNSTKET